MAVDHIRYDILTQEALRGVVRTVLIDAAANGLPGEHHFFISFDTTAEGVRISPRLKAQYPAEMTVVLQHQFWDLIVNEESFEVGLSFNGIPERLFVPFAAVKGFFDPSVQFALQFAATVGEAEAAADDKPPAAPEQPQSPAVAPPPEASADDRPPTPEEGAAVVSLDRFRKKK
jgi:uncharacterized protein